MISLSRPIVVSGPWPGRTTVSSGLDSATLASDSWISRERPTRQVGATDRAGEQQIAGEELVAAGEGDRAAGVTWCELDREVHAGQAQRLVVGELADVRGLRPLEPAEDRRVGRDSHRAVRVAQHRAVFRVDQGGDVMRAAHGGHRPDVVDVTMAQQDRHGLQVVLGQHLVELGHGVVPRVDDDALLATSRRHDETVRPPRSSREPDDKHERPFRWASGQPSEPLPRLSPAIPTRDPEALPWRPVDVASASSPAAVLNDAVKPSWSAAHAPSGATPCSAQSSAPSR